MGLVEASVKQQKSTKRIFITGATSGIGLSLAEFYLAQGHQVALTGRDLSKIPPKVREHAGAHCFAMDVVDLQQQVIAMDAFVKKVGGVDIVIANAGRSVGSKTRLPDFAVGRDIFNTNLMGLYNTFDVALRHMIPHKKGQLVAIASVAGYVGLPGASAYSASKAAVLTLCESFALDLKEFGIDVTAIAPGFIDTPLTKKNDHSMPFLMSSERAAKLIAKAIACKCVLYAFPWQMNIVITILQKIPRFVYRRLMSVKSINYSK
jgi:NAD(P)-dependent dehydrogenase (short-subunit alcohol dehydrogenase family)